MHPGIGTLCIGAVLGGPALIGVSGGVNAGMFCSSGATGAPGIQRIPPYIIGPAMGADSGGGGTGGAVIWTPAGTIGAVCNMGGTLNCISGAGAMCIGRGC